AQQGEDQCRIFQPPVVDLHRDTHRDDTSESPCKLPSSKIVGGPVSLFRHDSRRAEHHHHTNKYEKTSNGKQPPIDTNAFSHGRIIPTRAGDLGQWISL